MFRFQYLTVICFHVRPRVSVFGLMNPYDPHALHQSHICHFFAISSVNGVGNIPRPIDFTLSRLLCSPFFLVICLNVKGR